MTNFRILIGPFWLNVFAMRNGSIASDAAVCVGRVWAFWDWK